MFIDVCFSNNNEKDFVKIANKLKTDSLIFLDKNTLKSKNVKAKFSNKFKSSKLKTVYFFDYGKKNFHTPIKLNQVFFKEIKKNSIVALPFNTILNNKNVLEQLRFIVKLCQKYNVGMCVASFAQSPYELRSKTDLLIFAKLLSVRNPKDCVSSLHDFILI